ncbi:hypothetical protein NEOLEDRAFT_71638 [Neolentinus lepideus HHB14362 ss-1]|uniref:Uncharacterized protein n=1 Tax=Neolentinus lepideus HHB14362 ss-1 TaxID=1314782 RepID=A0A165UBZ1_9AGAM|nr:hypothetical protein NEOLEDRAFT_71638 [Neolentinus lepideus HHB14362 ss-1]
MDTPNSTALTENDMQGFLDAGNPLPAREAVRREARIVTCTQNELLRRLRQMHPFRAVVVALSVQGRSNQRRQRRKHLQRQNSLNALEGARASIKYQPTAAASSYVRELDINADSLQCKTYLPKRSRGKHGCVLSAGSTLVRGVGQANVRVCVEIVVGRNVVVGIRSHQTRTACGREYRRTEWGRRVSLHPNTYSMSFATSYLIQICSQTRPE